MATRTHSKTALVTGGSQGIGAELARLLAAARYDLILVARSSQALAELSDELRARYGVSVRVATMDLAQPHAAERLWAEGAGPDGGVDVLINNAGAGLHGTLAEHDAGALQQMVELNVAALTTPTRLAVAGELPPRRIAWR